MAKIGIFNTLITAIIMVIIKPIVKGEAFSVMLVPPALYTDFSIAWNAGCSFNTIHQRKFDATRPKFIIEKTKTYFVSFE